MKKKNENREEITLITDKKGINKFACALNSHKKLFVFIKGIKIPFPLISLINLCEKGELIPEESITFMYKVLVNKKTKNTNKKQMIENINEKELNKKQKGKIFSKLLEKKKRKSIKNNLPFQDMFPNINENMTEKPMIINKPKKPKKNEFEIINIPQNQSIVGKKWGIKKNQDNPLKNISKFHNLMITELNDNEKTEEDKLIITNKNKNMLEMPKMDEEIICISPLNLDEEPKIIFKIPDNKNHQNIRYEISDSSYSKSQEDKVNVSKINSNYKEKDNNIPNKLLMNQLGFPHSKLNNKSYKNASQSKEIDERSQQDRASEFTNNDQRTRTREDDYFSYQFNDLENGLRSAFDTNSQNNNNRNYFNTDNEDIDIDLVQNDFSISDTKKISHNDSLENNNNRNKDNNNNHNQSFLNKVWIYSYYTFLGLSLINLGNYFINCINVGFFTIFSFIYLISNCINFLSVAEGIYQVKIEENKELNETYVNLYIIGSVITIIINVLFVEYLINPIYQNYILNNSFFLYIQIALVINELFCLLMNFKINYMTIEEKFLISLKAPLLEQQE